MGQETLELQTRLDDLATRLPVGKAKKTNIFTMVTKDTGRTKRQRLVTSRPGCRQLWAFAENRTDQDAVWLLSEAESPRHTGSGTPYGACKAKTPPRGAQAGL
jgi:hypothetical protein